MITIEHDIQINCPVEEAFKYAADPRNDPKWCPPVMEVTQQQGSGLEVGARYHVKAKPGPKVVQGPCEIVELRPNEWVKCKGQNDALHYTYSYEFTPTNDGTNLHMHSELRLKGLWKLLKPVIKSDSEKVAKEEFNNLKEQLEK